MRWYSQGQNDLSDSANYASKELSHLWMIRRRSEGNHEAYQISRCELPAPGGVPEMAFSESWRLLLSLDGKPNHEEGRS